MLEVNMIKRQNGNYRYPIQVDIEHHGSHKCESVKQGDFLVILNITSVHITMLFYMSKDKYRTVLRQHILENQVHINYGTASLQYTVVRNTYVP
jgi:hypothetical protein